jgi:heme/copper-type cytochrome/quinol oxidase subunit 3
MSEALIHPENLPVGSVGHKSSGWWGMLALIATEAALFAYLLFSYFYLTTQAHHNWFPTQKPALTLALPNTFILIASSFTAWWGEQGIRRGDRLRLLTGLGLTFLLGCIFAGIQLREWHSKSFSLTDSVYASMYYTITGFHMLHVFGGLLMLLCLLLWSWLGKFDRQRYSPVSTGIVYWHFVDIVWLAVFSTFYIFPYLD